MADTIAERAGETVQAVVAQATADAAAAIETVEARAAVADATIEALTDAAIRDRLSARIDDCEEGINECQKSADDLANDLQAVELTVQNQALQLSALTAQLTTLLSVSSQQQSHQPPRREEHPSQSEAPPIQTPDLSADQSQTSQNGNADGHQEAPPKRKSRLI